MQSYSYVVNKLEELEKERDDILEFLNVTTKFINDRPNSVLLAPVLVKQSELENKLSHVKDKILDIHLHLMDWEKP